MAITTRPATDAYRKGWERCFGKAACRGPKREIVAYPADKPPRYNGCSQPCDVWSGPCCCGAWHDGKDHKAWLADRAEHLHGLLKKRSGRWR